MNVNVYLEESLAKQLTECVKTVHKSRNTIIREAIKEWIQHHQIKKWPKSVLNFKGHSDFTPFEKARKDLSPPSEDPLA